MLEDSAFRHINDSGVPNGWRRSVFDTTPRLLASLRASDYDDCRTVLLHSPRPPRAFTSAGTQGAPRPVTLSYPGTERSELSTFSTMLPLLSG